MERKAIQESVIHTLCAETEALAALERDLDKDQLADAVQMLAACRGKIILSGCGTSAMAAKKAAHSLCCVERPALFLSPSDAVHGGLGVLQPEDILILISKGGNTAELAALIPACKTKGARLIAVTENPGSVIGQQADCCLTVRVAREACPFNMLATSSTLAVIAVFDALCIALMEATGYTREQFAVIHPGGAVGERLRHGTKTETGASR